jgi:ADP-ribosyl-[dinitrogen reductase] hydrolase
MNAENYKATLLGCAIGDTLGMPVEGWKRQQIAKHVGRITEPMEPFTIHDSSGRTLEGDEFGKLKYYSLGLKKGDYTDDTILTLAIAESIAGKCGLNLEDAARLHLAEYESRVLPDGTVKGGFGWITIQAFKKLQNGISPLESGVISKNPGNAPAMKMAPVGMYMAATGFYGRGIQFAEDVSRMTHLDSRSVAGGVVQAHAVFSVLDGCSREEFAESLPVAASNIEREYPAAPGGTLVSRLEWIRDNMYADSEDAFNALGNKSNVLQSYPFALFMFQKYWDSPLEGLLETVNYGGDCDTTGAMYGTLAGAKNGIFFPTAWVDALSGKERIIAAAEEIYELRKRTK